MPVERTAPPRELEIRPRQVRAWIESLPLAQTIDAARKMAEHLAALNRSKIDLDDRLQILEHYRPFAATVLDELDAIYGKAALPLSARARDALTHARRLAFEMAVGYRIAINERSGKLLAFGGKKQLPVYALRAMEYLGAELRASYKSYSPVPAHVWHEMHHLYLYADKEGFASEPADAETKATVSDAYCEALLLSLTDPYRLVPGEAEKIIAQIRGLRGLATLGQTRPGTRSGAHFLVPCDTDKSPKPALSASDETGGPNWRLLDANPIVDKLRARKAAIDSGNVSATMSRAVNPETLAMMAKLIALWGDPPKRAYRRDPMDTSVAICVGLKSISHFIAHEAEVEAEAIRAGITIPLLAVPNDEVSKTFPVFEWDVVNQSEGGVKVRRVEATLQPVAVGEVVGVKFLGKPRWTIAVVRWMTQLDEGGMEFGLQFLAPAARVVWVQPSMSSSPQAKLGLVLDDEEAEEASLLTIPNLYQDLRVYELEEQGSTWSVRATNLIEKTSRFELFHVAPV
jgi:hypothetical protein